MELTPLLLPRFGPLPLSDADKASEREASPELAAHALKPLRTRAGMAVTLFIFSSVPPEPDSGEITAEVADTVSSGEEEDEMPAMAATSGAGKATRPPIRLITCLRTGIPLQGGIPTMSTDGPKGSVSLAVLVTAVAPV